MKKLTVSLLGLISILFATPAMAQVPSDQARMYQIDATHSGSVTSPGLVPPLKQKWSVNFGQDISYPLIADGKVFVTVRHASVYGTTLYALNAADGATLWSYELGGPYYWSALCYENGRVFALIGDGLLRAFDGASGALIWSRQLPGQYSFNSPPTVFQGVVYAGGSGNGGTAYAVSADTGNVLWTAPVSNAGNSSPAVTTDGVYLSYACINVYKLNPANGSVIWRNYVACGSGNGRVPVLYNNRLYVRSPGSNTDWIYNSQTGGTFDTFMSKSAPAFSGSKGFFLNGPRSFGSYGTLEGRDVNSNLVLWTFAGDGFLQSSMLVVNDYVYVGSNSGKLFAVEAATGHQVWSTTAGTSIPYVDELNSSQPLTGFAAGEGILVIPTRTTLVAYESDNAPTITWDNPTPAKNVYGWNNTPVQLSFTAVAHPSGLAFATPGSPLQFNSEGNNLTQQVTVTDQLGNSATLTSPVVKIDLNSPATTSAVSGTVGPGVTAWYKDSAQVTLTKTDNLSGVRSTSYTIDGGATQNYFAPFVIQTDGSHTLNFWSSDYAGNDEIQQSIFVNVDANPPSTQISAGSGFYASPAEVTLTATDSGSGVSSTFYRIDSGATQTYSTPFMVSGDSNRQIVYWSVDWAGHTENQHFFTLKLDGSAPSTGISTTGTNGWNGWKTSPVQVTLSPSDTRSGVAATYYTVDGGPTQTYSGPFMINESAAHQVNYWSVDNVGNTEAQKSAEVKIDKEGPTTESSLAGPAGNNGYYLGPVQVALTATDNVSGLASSGTHYKIDNGPQMAYMSAPFTVSGDGTHTVSFWSTDLAGNDASPNTITIKIDATAPSTQAALSGTPGVNGWYSTAVQVTLSATDSTSGPGSSYYAVDGGLQQTYAGPFTLSTTGSHTVLYWSRDVADNVEAQHSLIIKVDVSSPTTIASASGSSGNGWYQAPAQVTLTASDDASGVGGTFYTIDGGPTQTYASPFNVSAGGIHSINYWSVDAVGNSEHQQSLTVQIDVTAPITVISPGGTAGNNGWYSSSVTVSLTASDNNQAGVATTYYSVDGGVTQTYAAPFTLSSSSTHTILYWSVDRAGNTESQQSMIINVDVDAPSTQAQVSATWSYDVWYQSPAQVSFTRSDVTSGVANTYYTIDGGAMQTYSAPVDISAGGIHTVNYWSVDTAGNAEAQKSVTVRVDNTAPSTQISTSGTVGTNGWYRSSVQASLAASDSQVGVNVTMYRVDGGPTMVYGGPFTVSGEGQHQVLYWSNDKLSNTEAQQTATIKIDSTVPTTQSSVSGPAGGNGYYKGPAQVTLTASDNLSGVANKYYRIDGGATQTYSAAFTVSSDGNHAVDFWSVDAAGNVGGVSTVLVKVDASAPWTQAIVSGTSGTNGWYLAAVQVSLTATDPLSGVQTTYYKLDGGTTKTYTAPFSVSGNGSHTVNFWSVDKATNTESMGSLVVKIDTNKPSVTASASPASALKGSNPITVTVSGHVTDTVSGAQPGGATYNVVDEYGVTQPSGTVILQANGNYSFTLSLPATRNNGDSSHLYTIIVQGFDQAGNAESASDTVKIN